MVLWKCYVTFSILVLSSWYLHMDSVTSETEKIKKNQELRLHRHPNFKVILLLTNVKTVHSFERVKKHCEEVKHCNF